MAEKTALITGITGQDGSYLAEFLLDRGYVVHGMVRRSSSFNRERIEHLYMSDLIRDNRAERLKLWYGDLTDPSSIMHIIQSVGPDEIYNLGAQSHVRISFDQPDYTAEVDGLGPLRVLEAVRILGRIQSTRIYQASTSELYGKVVETPQSESTPFYPRSPYGVAKLYGFWISKNYREAYDMFAANGILFNHESPRRGANFVSRKITLAVARIAHGQQHCLHLGNLDAQRDWGYAKDYVECMWKILQHDVADDWVLATGKTHTVRRFAELAFAQIGRTIQFEGEGADEKGVDRDSGDVLIRIDPKYYRPSEVDLLVGDSSKAQRELGWNPTQTSFEQLVEMMVRSDYDLVRNQRVAD